MGGEGCNLAYQWGGGSETWLVVGGDGGVSDLFEGTVVTADEASGLSEEKDPEEIKGYKAFTAGMLHQGKKNKSEEEEEEEEEEKEGRSINCWNGWYKGEEEY